MWHPLQREHLVLETGLAPDECARRIAQTAETGGRSLWFPGLRPVLGFVGRSRFVVARHPVLQIPLETWISGSMGGIRPPTAHAWPGAGDRRGATRIERGTRIEVAIGPNAPAGLALTAVGAMLLGAALLLTKLAFDGAEGAVHGLFISWMVVIGFFAAFFVIPAVDHSNDRAFLIDYLCSTLRAAVVAVDGGVNRRSRKSTARSSTPSARYPG
jgi:hypothetical protein